MKTTIRFAVQTLAIMVLCSTIQGADLRSQLAEAQQAADNYAQIELIRRILDQEQDAALRQQLAELWLAVADYDMAERTISEWKDAPASVRTHVLAEVLFQRDEKRDEAIAMLQSYLKEQPSDLAIVRQLAGYLGAARQNKQVVELLTQTPGVNQTTDLLIVRANAKRTLLDLTGALADFTAAEKLNPEDPTVTSHRAAYERIKTSLKNIDLATAAMKQHPTDLGPVLSRASWYLYVAAYPQALKDAQAAQAMAPNSVAAALMAAHASGLLGQLSYPEARDKLEIDLSKQPPTLEVLALILKYDVALLKNPTDARALAERSAILIDLQQYLRALSDANASLAIDPTNGPAHSEKISALIKLGRLDEAEGALRIFTTTKPAKDKLAAALSALTEAAFASSQLEPALDYINEAISLKPTAYYYKQRAAIYSRLDRNDEANQDLAKARQLEGGRR